MKDAAYHRAYRAKRKEQDPAYLPAQAENAKQYRRKRRLRGDVVRGVAKRTLKPFMGWDGEGITRGEQHDGKFPSQIKPYLRFRTEELMYIAGMKHRKAREKAKLDLVLAKPAPHTYVMLCNSKGESVEVQDDGFGPPLTLGTQAVFEFLLEQSLKYPGHTHIMYAGGYDVTMWLLELSKLDYGVPEPKPPPPNQMPGANGLQFVRRICKTKDTNKPVHVRVGNRIYAVQYRPGKFFFLARMASNDPREFWKDRLNKDGEPIIRKDGKRSRIPNYDAKIMLWDVFGFFQTSFVEALKKFDISCDLDMIADMKQKRSSFAPEDIPKMQTYCVAECQSLVELMTRLRQNFVKAKLYLSRWDGPGAGAARLLQNHEVKQHIQLEPEHLREPVARAFFGGRIELNKIGRGPVYGHDLSSAYPAIIANLPSLVGEWKPITKLKPLTKQITNGTCAGRHILVRASWKFRSDAPWYPLPYRVKDHGDHRILFPLKGSGYYWLPEIIAAKAWERAFAFGRADLEKQPPDIRAYMEKMLASGEADTLLPKGIAIEEAWEFFPDKPEDRPFSFVPELYLLRQSWKLNNEQAEYVLRLVLNSLYGKLAQQVGVQYDEDGKVLKLPPYMSMVWAGMITAGTRAALVHAALTDPHRIIAFATDGLYSEVPLSKIGAVHKDKATLGGWVGPDAYDDAVFVQPGVYWTQEPGKEWKSKYRGFDREGMLTPDRVLAGWHYKQLKLTLQLTRFVKYGIAFCGLSISGPHKDPPTHRPVPGDMWEWRGTWRTEPRDLKLTGAGAKRHPVDPKHDLTTGYYPLPVCHDDRKDQPLSAPYEGKLKPGYVMVEDDEEHDLGDEAGE